jgi:hypothetical protein
VPARHLLCLVAGATHRLPDATIHALARRLLAAGAVWLVVWGPGADHTHALFRDAVLMAERSQTEETTRARRALEAPAEFLARMAPNA